MWKQEFVSWADAPQRYEELWGKQVAAKLVAEGKENRDKGSVASKRWTSFYAEDLAEALCAECPPNVAPKAIVD